MKVIEKIKSLFSDVKYVKTIYFNGYSNEKINRDIKSLRNKFGFITERVFKDDKTIGVKLYVRRW